MPDLLPFVREPAIVAPTRAATAELVYLAATSFAVLRDVLRAAVPFFEKRRRLRGQWGVPELFYFDQTRDAELGRCRMPTDEADRKAAAAEPAAHRASLRLPDLCDDALTLAYHGPELRRAMRATSSLTTLVEAWAAEHPKLKSLEQTFQVSDDDVVRVVDPARRFGARISVNGVATMRQFHELFADLVDTTPSISYEDGEPVFTARRQFVRPSALGRAGSIEGWSAVDHWLWGMESLKTLPRFEGDRLVLIAEPTISTTWISEIRDTGVRPEATMPAEMTANEVDEFLRMWTGREQTARLHRAA